MYALKSLGGTSPAPQVVVRTKLNTSYLTRTVSVADAVLAPNYDVGLLAALTQMRDGAKPGYGVPPNLNQAAFWGIHLWIDLESTRLASGQFPSAPTPTTLFEAWWYPALNVWVTTVINGQRVSARISP